MISAEALTQVDFVDALDNTNKQASKQQELQIKKHTIPNEGWRHSYKL